MNAEIIGWISSVILLATLVKQVHTQYRTEATAGVSPWLYWGELVASGGFAVYRNRRRKR